MKNNFAAFLNMPSVALIEDLEYFQKKLWVSLAIPKTYFDMGKNSKRYKIEPAIGSIRFNPETNVMETYTGYGNGFVYEPIGFDTGYGWKKVIAKQEYDQGYFYCPYIPVEFIKIERPETPAEAYERAMKIIK